MKQEIDIYVSASQLLIKKFQHIQSTANWSGLTGHQ